MPLDAAAISQERTSLLGVPPPRQEASGFGVG